MTKSYTALEQRAEALKTFLDTEVVNPLVSDKGVAEYRAQKDALIKEYGMIPVMLYDAQFAGYVDLNTPEKREKIYHNWDKMKESYASFLNRPELFDPAVTMALGDKTFNYKQWEMLAEGQLEPLSELQKKALYAAALYMQQNSYYKESYPLHTAIQDPSSRRRLVGDCNVLTALYANLLLDAKDEQGTNIFRPEDIQIECHPNHTRLKIKDVRYETTSHFVLTPKSNGWEEKGTLAGLNSLLGANILEDTEGQNIDKNNADLQISRSKQAYIYYPIDIVKDTLQEAYKIKYDQYMGRKREAIKRDDKFGVYVVSKEADAYVAHNQLEAILSSKSAGQLVNELKAAKILGAGLDKVFLSPEFEGCDLVFG